MSQTRSCAHWVTVPISPCSELRAHMLPPRLPTCDWALWSRCQDTLTKIKQAILQRGTNGSVLISIIIISEWIIFYHLMNYCCWQDELDFCQMKSWWWEEHRVLCRGGIIKIVQEWFWATHYNKFWLYLLNTLHCSTVHNYWTFLRFFGVFEPKAVHLFCGFWSQW